ncbi:MAG: hypothetical protein VSS52_012340 [Thiotrichaceae bacterium]|nr:hypothetical protein [Thiotrichaceae bacterium]
MRALTTYKTLIHIIWLSIITALVVDLFYLLAIRVFVFLLIATLMMIGLSSFAISHLQVWLKKKVVMDLKMRPVPRDYMYLPIEKKESLKKAASDLTVIDRQSLDRNRLSVAELNQIEELFKDTFADEILERLTKLAEGETKVLHIFKIKHDLWGLAIINLILLLISFIVILNIVFILRSFYHQI